MKTLRLLFVALLLSATSLISPSNAYAAVVYSSHWGGTGGFGLNSGYWAAHKFTAGSNASITSISVYLASGSISRLVLRANSNNAPGVAIATMTSSTISSTTQTFTGSFNMTSGTTYWLSAEMTSGAASLGVRSTVQDTSAYGWSSGGTILSSLDAGGTWGTTYVGSAQTFILQMDGTSVGPLATPSTPVLNSSTSTSISVSETSTTPNATSYTVSLFQSNGTTLVESRTVLSITSPVQFSGLSPAVTYKVSVTAIGDGISYNNSSPSALLSVTTAGTTSVALSGLTNILYRKSIAITATVIGGNGKVSLSINGKRIPRCQNLLTTSLSATCTFLPSIRGQARLTVLFTPTSPSLEPSSNLYQISIGNRSGRR